MKKKSKAKSSVRKRISIPDCKHFTGYKPCFPDTNCLEKCVDPKPRGSKILIINLEAMGNVLVTTTLLPAIKRKYPQSTVFWITLRNAAPLLLYNQYIDKVFVWEPQSWLVLQAMQFDLVMNIDKASHACAFMMSLNSRKKVGYGLKNDGALIPLNKEAEHNYLLGLDDEAKFRVNQKSNSQLLTEAMGLRYHRDEYLLQLSDEELEFCHRYKQAILSHEPPHAAHRSPLIVGFNTGCSLLYPNKKMTIDQYIILIDELSKRAGIRLLLLGGTEDTARNAEIARQAGIKVINTPTTEGLRRGICYENVCDLVITGDSLGMHIAIALKKHVLVWFGVSCPPEVDLFGRGVKFIPEGLACSPCWKKECPYNLECVQMVDLEAIVAEVDNHRREFSRTGK